jgi:glycosyltransferase involved in cell wall biosynthesis
VRILFINEHCGYFGGIEQNVADTAMGLRQRGHTCYLAYGMETTKDSTRYQTLFDGCYPCAELHPSVSTLVSQQLPQLIAELVPDAIYVHKVATMPQCLLRTAPTPTIRMVHDHDMCCPRRHKYFTLSGRVCHHKAGWRCWVDGAFVARDPNTRTGFTLRSFAPKLHEMRRNHACNRLLVGSRFMREELLSNGFPAAKVHILPPVVHVSEPQSPFPLPTKPHIVYVGQLIRGKGVDLLLQALRHVTGDYVVTLVGTGNAYDPLVDLSRRLGVADRVHFQGWIDHAQLGAYYSAATVVAVPSRWPEPFGMVGLEAMQHGRAVVAFNVGGIADWLKHDHTGLLVPEQDVQAFGHALQRLISSPALAAHLGERAYSYVQQHYNFSHYLDRLESHLRGVPEP